MTDEDRAELTELFGEQVHHQGISIPSTSGYRRAYVERAETGTTDLNPTPTWD